MSHSGQDLPSLKDLTSQITTLLRLEVREAEVEVLGAIVEGGKWTTLHDPHAARPKGGKKLSFITADKGDWCFSPEEPERMIRISEHPLVWQRLKDLRNMKLSHAGLLLVGHPGIGKTLFLDVLLSWSLHADPKVPVVVIAAEGVTIFATVNGQQKRYYVAMEDFHPDEVCKLLLRHCSPDSEVIVLHDIKTSNTLCYKSGFIGTLAKEFRVSCVLASSPKEDNYKDFEKDFKGYGVFDRFYLPTLTYDEAREYVIHFARDCTAEDFDEWYYAVGGVPRDLTNSKAVEDAKRKQKQAVKTLAFDIGYKPETHGADEDTHVLVQGIPYDDRRWVDVYDFVSGHARELWIGRQGKAAMQKLFRRMR